MFVEGYTGTAHVPSGRQQVWGGQDFCLARVYINASAVGLAWAAKLSATAVVVRLSIFNFTM